MRRLTGLALVLTVVFAIAAPAAIEHGGPIEGRWPAVDNYDGSLMQMTINETDDDLGLFTIVYADTRATLGCDRAARFVAVSTTATWSDEDGRLFADFDPPVCFGNSEPQVGAFTIEFDPGGIVDPEDHPELFPDEWDGTLIDWFGNVWYHVSRRSGR